MDNIGTVIGVFGGIGLGLLLGSGYPGSTTTMLGAAVTIVALGSMALMSLRKRKTEK